VLSTLSSSQESRHVDSCIAAVDRAPCFLIGVRAPQDAIRA
jgi:hypothetical protein